jgi:hypothetical protein
MNLLPQTTILPITLVIMNGLQMPKRPGKYYRRREMKEDSYCHLAGGLAIVLTDAQSFAARLPLNPSLRNGSGQYL